MLSVLSTELTFLLMKYSQQVKGMMITNLEEHLAMANYI